MLTLYSLLGLLLVAALVLFLYPFEKYLKLYPQYFTVSCSLLIIISITFYYFLGNKTALHQWLNQGKQHFQLLETFDALGGVEGAITKIKNKLAENPIDAKGWYILAKLYAAKGDHAEAIHAIKQAIKIDPNNSTFTDYLNKLNGEKK
jgi:cytochrome c-type biogenesis protein CcmH/NrfG